MTGKIYETITLKNGGDRVVIKFNNLVIDVIHGYHNPENEAAGIIDIYPFDSDKPHHYLIHGDKNQIIYSH